MFRHALSGAGVEFSPELIAKITATRNYAVQGIFAADSGYIFMSILWSGSVVAMTERQFRRAAAWMLGAAAFSALGFMHATKVTSFDVIGSVTPAWTWVWAYVATAVVLALIPVIARPTDSPVIS